MNSANPVFYGQEDGHVVESQTGTQMLVRQAPEVRYSALTPSSRKDVYSKVKFILLSFSGCVLIINSVEILIDISHET